MALPQKLQEFLTEGNQSLLRPFNTGIHQHEGSVATILLYTGNQLSEEAQEHPERNYLTDLENTIYDLQSESIGATDAKPPQLPGGKIAAISLDSQDPTEDNYYGVFNNFSLQSVAERHEETIKLHQNFSQGWNAFFFGEKPVIYQFGGVFLDTMEFPYYQEFMIAYQKYLAGRKVIENRMQMKMVYDGKIIDGYMINLNAGGTSDVPSQKSFSFNVLIRDVQWIRFNLIPARGNIGVGWVPAYNKLTNIPRLSGSLRDQPRPFDGAGDISQPSLA